MSSKNRNETQRANTRSRTGCIKCRERRVRCDERRPSCVNCNEKKVLCVYTPARVPLRDRRSQPVPGQQAPWPIQEEPPAVSDLALIAQDPPASRFWQMVVSASPEPFDVLPIKMPLKSKNLLHYFIQVSQDFGILPPDAKRDWMSLASHEPNTLRNALLVAGVHYSCNTRQFKSFEPTFLFHKIEIIQSINKYLTSNYEADSVVSCARYINTLCFIESLFGNIAVAEAHLNGLLKILDARLPTWDDTTVAGRVEKELMNSCLSDPDVVMRRMHEWNIYEVNGVGLHLYSLCMLPYFFASVSLERTPRLIDARPILKLLQEITSNFDSRHSGSSAHGATDANLDFCHSGITDRLLYAVVSSHTRSVSVGSASKSSSNGDLILSSWSALTVAIEMFLTSVVSFWNQELTSHNQLFRRLLAILEQDLRTSLEDKRITSFDIESLWIWKAFTCSIYLSHVDPGGSDEWLEKKKSDLDSCIRSWSKMTGTTGWKEVNEMLKLICWPSYSDNLDMAKSVWTRIQGSSIIS
ncbi:hypothetical protein FZEAL_7866 [Fusarium zealandicum]|uniref:Zn(2)-C6 fungal-type domain-containing protein n=1 Tax=Fusarium zealandicum TaxID=1053134 RepID=A0A8H4UFV4_9HYPO|nr:hypothetical protein FZEAL_7866 [Fusarium zealandicum]